MHTKREPTRGLINASRCSDQHHLVYAAIRVTLKALPLKVLQSSTSAALTQKQIIIG